MKIRKIYQGQRKTTIDPTAAPPFNTFKVDNVNCQGPLFKL